MVVPVDAVVADVGGGEDHDLAGVAGVGEDLLVAGHAGVEDHLAAGFHRRAEQPAGKNPAGFQGDEASISAPSGGAAPSPSGGGAFIRRAMRSMGSISVSMTEPRPIRYWSRCPRPRLKPARRGSPGRHAAFHGDAGVGQDVFHAHGDRLRRRDRGGDPAAAWLTGRWVTMKGRLPQIAGQGGLGLGVQGFAEGNVPAAVAPGCPGPCGR